MAFKGSQRIRLVNGILMSVLNLIQLKDGVTIGGFVLLILLTCVQIAPIKINPWDAIFSWFGKKLNKDITAKVDAIEKKLDEHIEDEATTKLENTRAGILDFANSCMNKRKHTKEEFDFIISKCDWYEEYIETNHIRNGVITSAIKEIRRIYEICIHENSFLKEE